MLQKNPAKTAFGSLSGQNNVVRITARQIQKVIINNDLALAKAIMQYLALHHRKAFESFMKKYADELP